MASRMPIFRKELDQTIFAGLHNQSPLLTMHYVIMWLIFTEKFIHVSLSTIILDIFPPVFAVTLVNLLTGASRDNELKSSSLVLY